MNKVDIKNDFYFMKEVALDFDDGWDNLIYDLCKELNEITPISLRNKFIVLQVKEKFGTLRFYVSYANKKMLDAIDRYEKLSYNTCESCGADGELRYHKWYKTLCEKCFSIYQEER